MLVKICGITTELDADACVALGASMLGLNFVQRSPRCIDWDRARRIVATVAGRAEIVGVVADQDETVLLSLRAELGLDRLQLHGAESSELVQRLAPWAFKAVRVGSREDLADLARYNGLLLIDAKAEGFLGGTGKQADLALAAEISAERPIVLAGGLTPANVAAAIKAVRPFGVDVASGVEKAPGVKDLEAVGLFIQEAWRAANDPGH
jgi:phosphoribosylanthranilate isomerase